MIENSSPILFNIQKYHNDPRKCALCIVTRSSGSSPGKTGAKMIVFDDGKIEGTVGGGAIEKMIIHEALEAIKHQAPVMKDYNLDSDLSMACGGNMSVYIEPLVKPGKLYIFGAGHVGKSLAKYTSDFGFTTYLIDWRTDIFEKPENLKYHQICKPYLEAIHDLAFDQDTYCVIVTPGHEMDEEVLAALSKKTTAYTGLIGSKTKVAALRKLFQDQHIMTEEELNRIDMPIGVKFNAITPAEIAISILARLIDVKNNKLLPSK